MIKQDKHDEKKHDRFSTNIMVANHLIEASEILQKMGANQYRVKAYRSAANTLKNLDQNIVDIIEKDDIAGLVKLPFIGKNIAYAIYELIVTGRWKFLESLRNSLKPPNVFTLIPGIGPKLAKQIYTSLHVKTLEDLELFSKAGKLIEIPGVGERRQRMITETLSSMLHGVHPYYAIQQDGPSIDELLHVDKLYRYNVEHDMLDKIAPKRFNPTGEKWLPIFHLKYKKWKFRVMFSNTKRAHILHKSQDWVIIHAYDENHHEYTRTVVTETRGPLKGKRVVRGFENECINYYEKQ